MTTGNVTNDGLITYPYNSPPGEFGVGSYPFVYGQGYYNSKTWTGGNRSSPTDNTPHSYQMSYTNLVTWPAEYLVSGQYRNSSPAAAFESELRFNPTATIGPNEILQLISRLRDRIEGSDFNLSITLGEGRETLTMIGSAFSSLLNGVKAAKRLDSRGVARALKKIPISARQLKAALKKKGDQASNLWLAYIFGWLPLLGDIEAGLKLLERLYSKPDVKRYSAQLTVKGSKPMPAVSNGRYSLPFPCIDIARGQLIAYVTNVNSATLQGLTNPFVWSWELTPFSFLADWIVPVGSYLDALNTASGLNASYVLTTTRNRTLKWSVPVPEPGITMLSPGYLYYRRMDMFRDPSPNLSAFIALPEFKSISSFASGRRLLTTVALLQQQLRKI